MHRRSIFSFALCVDPERHFFNAMIVAGLKVNVDRFVR